MRYFDVEEHFTEDGGVLVITAKNGMRFDDGSTTRTITLRSDYGPRIGERVTCGNFLVKVLQKRYGSDGKLWLFDEDTRVWFEYEGKKPVD